MNQVFRVMLMGIMAVSVFFGLSPRFEGSGTPWIAFVIALGFLAVIEAVGTAAEAIIAAAASRSAIAAKDRKAVADRIMPWTMVHAPAAKE